MADRFRSKLSEQVNSQQYHSLFADRLIISAGVLDPNRPSWGAGPMSPGLKVVVILSGEEQVKIEGHPTFGLKGPQSCIILNPQDTHAVHWVASLVPLRFAVVHALPSFADEEFGVDLGKVLRNAGYRDKPLLHLPAINPTLRSLATQIIACPMTGAIGRMYLAAKGLELMASALNPLLAEFNKPTTRLSSADIDRVHAAHEILIENFRSPPSLAQLARAVGLNATKLTMGFRSIFGTTAFGVLQEHRLQQAYRMLSSGEMSVSEVAYHVGYAPAHFATIFRQRFGVSPNALRQ